ncbi:hypothetical protein ACUSRP_003623 [Vibrio alginolyticus]
MYIPSRFLFDVISSEQLGIFCESNSDGEKSIIAKLPSNTLKALALGAKSEVLVFISRNYPKYIALVLKVHDSESPLFAVMPQRWHDNLFNRINSDFFNEDISFVLYDETDAPVQFGKIKIKTNFRNKKSLFFIDNKDIESANDYSNVNKFLDAIFNALGEKEYETHGFSLQEFKFNIEISELQSLLTIHANEIGVTDYNLVDDIDGDRQEKQAFQALSLMNNSTCYLSPNVTIGKQTRELTDILCVTKSSDLIAIESKCLQVDRDKFDKTYERLASRLVKHCKKAIGQLQGGYKALKRGEEVTNESGEIIPIIEDFSFHGVVLIDEFKYSPSWDEVFNLVENVKSELGISINVIPISEFIYTMKLYNSDIESFSKSLELRFDICIENKSFDVKFVNSALPEI